MARTHRFVIAFLIAVVGLTGASPAGAQARPASIEPVPVLTGVADVSAGSRFGCARLVDGHIVCWGSNDAGQLGWGQVGDTIQRASQVYDAAGTGHLSNVIGITTGTHHACALLANHQVRCWGLGDSGQLGNGLGATSLRPVPVLAVAGSGRLRDVTQITADGNTTCARLASGQARCWGENTWGQLGNGGDTGPRLRPVVVKAPTGSGPLTQVTQLDAGLHSVCARLASGQARCWGDNQDGQLGDGTDTPRRRPAVVTNARGTAPLTGVRDISAGNRHSCAVLADGTARCWGDNGQGQLGDDTFEPHRRPKPVVGTTGTGLLRNVDRLDAATSHSCARLAGGQVRCWGGNEYAELGNGVDAGPASPRPGAVRNRTGTANLAGVRTLQATAQHTCVGLRNGQARCWGMGADGGLGDQGETDRSLPVPVFAAPTD